MTSAASASDTLHTAFNTSGFLLSLSKLSLVPHTYLVPHSTTNSVLSIWLARAEVRIFILTMKLIGLGGGIACGKSTVSSVLAAEGLRVLDFDLIAHET